MKNAKILGQLHKLEDYTEDQKQALMQKQLKNKKMNKNSKPSAEQQNINDFLEEEKHLQMMGQEFNSSKYIT